MTASIDFQGQDTLELCQTTEIINDEVAERTEYFTVTLHRRLGGELASCQVAITDRNGGKVQCLLVENRLVLSLLLLHSRSP